jgi:Dolichyl-phosphate-mannose-protein mannosyltransferase
MSDSLGRDAVAIPARTATLQGPRTVALGVGLATGAVSIGLYARSGYGDAVLALWLVALVALTTGFALSGRPFERPAWVDLAVAAGLAALLSPLYLLRTHAWPVQVGSDEIAIMWNAERWAQMPGVDPFGLSDYLGHPTLLLVALGEAGGRLGGVELAHMRLVHGVLGLAAIVAAYAFLRQLLPRWWAVVATVILGANHSLFMLSRMAMRENTAVLVEAAALALLLRGLRRDHALSTFAGGVVAGLGFYVYFPGRAAVVLWALFLAAVAVWFRRDVPPRLVGRHGAVALTGFTLLAGPVVVAGLQAPPEVNEQQRLALMVFPEARELQRQWVFEDTVLDGYVNNVWLGLSAFNNLIQDHAWNYPNRGHGFLDPASGALLWVGLLAVGWSLARRRGPPWLLLPVVGFVTLWLSFALLVNKAPNYPRLLVTLPFVAYFAAEGIRRLSEAAGRRWGRRTVPLVAGAALAVIVAWNVSIAWDFVDRGRRYGDDIGSTGRIIESIRDRPGQRFYVAASEEQPYYVFGFPETYDERVLMFARDERKVGGVVPPRMLETFEAPVPFALFMSRAVWIAHIGALEERYPGARIRDVTPDGRLVVLEVL